MNETTLESAPDAVVEDVNSESGQVSTIPTEELDRLTGSKDRL